MDKYKVSVTKLSDGRDIPSDEPIFILRAQDVLAPIALRFYADLVQGAIGDFRVAEQIRDFALIMASWSPRKLPD